MKKYSIQKHIDEIKTNIISNILWYIISLLIGNIALWIPLIQGVYNVVHKSGNTIPLYAYILAGASILLLTAIILFLILVIRNDSLKKERDIDDSSQKVNDASSNNDYSDIPLDYKFSSIIAEMTFDDNRVDIESTIDYKMLVLKDGVNELKRQLIWSGSEYIRTELVERNGNYSLDDSERALSPFPYIIKFNENKKCGDRVEFKTRTLVKDGNMSMIPMYSFMVKYQIDKLTLRIIAPKDMIKNVKKVVYADSAREICVEESKEIYGETIRDLVRYTFEIKNPALLYNYFIEWEFTNP